MSKLTVYTLKNSNGMELEVSNFGATIISLKVPNNSGTVTNVVVGLEEAQDYIKAPYTDVTLFLGSTVGRYAGRISKGKFEIDGKVYPLEHNEGVHLHGGEGFDKKYWSLKSQTESAIVLTYVSPHFENGYPGELKVEASFEITYTNSFKINYSAITDQATPVNLTIHPYINLNGSGTVLDQELWINSKQHLEVDDQLIPSGRILDSMDTAFDYTISSKINKPEFEGFDDTFVMGEGDLKASLHSSQSGIKMNVYHSQPAMVIYTPKQFPNLQFKNNLGEGAFPAICFEPQNYPDAPHNSHFPNSILKPNQTYHNNIVFEFKVSE
ncbi:aldose 1-epimerase [Flavobacterium sp. 7E]|uniref:aldose epimerase family protein n=1 Tax=Flavobacterium sp. 7E TaxID=2735898 RepID=UPI00156E2C8C|nr:aldose epimerase family protein [Flavobacterium sp. 7E]NRS88420.1 aldose 1-epimerase [Flavobacterium sp. 7E]